MTTQLKAPTPAQVDALVKKYSDAQAVLNIHKAQCKAGEEGKPETAADKADALKQQLVTMVETFGFRHTEKSKRLKGIHSLATTTTATRMSIDDDAVDDFRSYLDKHALVELSGRFFVAHTTYTLVDSPGEVLRTLALGKKLRDKISSLIGLCFKVTTNAPSLKVDTAVAEKP